MVAIALQYFLILPLQCANSNFRAFSREFFTIIFATIFIIVTGASIVNKLGKLEQRLETRAQENETLIDKLQQGLIIISQERQEPGGKEDSGTDTLVLCNIKAECILRQRESQEQ